jgi:hypothetical protein
MEVVKQSRLLCEKFFRINVLCHLTSATTRFNSFDKPVWSPYVLFA